MRAAIDKWTEKITRLDFLLGGDEVAYPQITGQAEFGIASFNWTYEWPTEEDLAALDVLTVREDLRLMEIRYKQYEMQDELSGIQLAFQNGIETPWFETQATTD